MSCVSATGADSRGANTIGKNKITASHTPLVRAKSFPSSQVQKYTPLAPSCPLPNQRHWRHWILSATSRSPGRLRYTKMCKKGRWGDTGGLGRLNSGRTWSVSGRAQGAERILPEELFPPFTLLQENRVSRRFLLSKSRTGTAAGSDIRTM